MVPPDRAVLVLDRELRPAGREDGILEGDDTADQVDALPVREPGGFTRLVVRLRGADLTRERHRRREESDLPVLVLDVELDRVQALVDELQVLLDLPVQRGERHRHVDPADLGQGARAVSAAPPSASASPRPARSSAPRHSSPPRRRSRTARRRPGWPSPRAAGRRGPRGAACVSGARPHAAHESARSAPSARRASTRGGNSMWKTSALQRTTVENCREQEDRTIGAWSSPT